MLYFLACQKNRTVVFQKKHCFDGLKYLYIWNGNCSPLDEIEKIKAVLTKNEFDTHG